MPSSSDTPTSPPPDDGSFPRVVDGVKIVGRIGTDPAELSSWADRIVDNGETLKDLEIADLRLLIEAVQAHPRVKLAPIRERGVAVSYYEVKNTTELRIDGGRVVRAEFGVRSSAESKGLDIRVLLFAATTFAGGADFDRASFAGWADFTGASFAGRADFGGASFAGWAHFDRASFADWAAFGGASFASWAGFGEASFAGGVGFDGAHFADVAGFDWASFAGGAVFNWASFVGVAGFAGASFAGQARFGGASFAGRADFTLASFAGQACFGGASFAGWVFGDLRACTVRDGSINDPPFIRSPGITRVRVVMRAFARWARHIWSWLRHGPISWQLVRALGGLHILNRASIVALILVPILSAVYVGLQHYVVDASSTYSPGLSAWGKLVIHIVGEHPHLGRTLAFTFFASVFVTLGLLIYQAFADDTVKELTEAQHVRDVDGRYPEESRQRNDGLRRALDKLREQSKRRQGAHMSFVKHHGELIWMPPRERIDWFEDQTLPTLESLQQVVNKANAKRAQGDKLSPAIDPKLRDGYVPGAERARICIEQGARAEYWLLAHTRVFWAWVSLLLYLAGIGCIMWVLVIQCHRVGKAAGWWSVEQAHPSVTPDAARPSGPPRSGVVPPMALFHPQA